MGIIYFVGCRDCKIYRNLGKCYTLSDHIKTRKDALQLAKKLEQSAFPEALLISFMGKHQGHNCTIFNDLAWSDKSIYPDFFDPMPKDVKEEINFWELSE